jgi:Tfp pilus assembly protein PilO
VNSNGKITALWISILFVVLVAAVGWVFGFTNFAVDEKLDECMQKLNTHDAIIMELREEKAITNNELNNINRRLDRIERLIEKNK